MNKKAYSHAVFDMDGTLLYTEMAYLASLQKVLEQETSKHFEFEELRQYFGSTSEATLQKLGVVDVAHALKEWNRIRLSIVEQTVRPFDGVVELIHALSDRGIKTAIVTARNRAEIVEDPTWYKVGQFFDIVIDADSVKNGKPHPESLLHYISLTGAKRENILYCGDSDFDRRCAEGAGVDFALAVWGATNPDIKANYYPASPGEILQLTAV